MEATSSPPHDQPELKKWFAKKDTALAQRRKYTFEWLQQIFGDGVYDRIDLHQFPCSSGLQSRDFLYVSDFINCIKLLIKNNIANGQVFNIGCGKSHQVKKAIVKINKKIRSGKPIFNKLKMRKEEQKFIYPDVSKIKKVLKWKPKTNFEVGIDKTIKFYKRNII